MKVKELIRIAEENDYELTECLEQYELVRRSGFLSRRITKRITIGKARANGLWISIKSLCDDKDFNMIKAAVEFAETPPEDREEEKRYYLRHKWLNLDTDNYLHLDVDDGSYMLDDNEEFSFTKIKLTEKEIEEIKEKFNTDLADFEEVEVKE